MGQGLTVIAIASELELRKLRPLIDVGRVEVHGGRKYFFGSMNGRDVCLVKTGAGRKNAAAAARKICSVVQPDLVIIAGAAGALDPALGLGAAIVVETVVRENNFEKIFCPGDEARHALAVLRGAGMTANAGCCCQVRTFMHRAVDKLALFEKTGAHIVDMESAAFGHEFQSAGVPFVNIRIVSDTARCDTADMETLVRMRYRRGRVTAAWYLLWHPRELVRTWLFYRGMAVADKRIAEAVSILMEANEFRGSTSILQK
jgi:adenosylhomocysteine nucleosidase